MDEKLDKDDWESYYLIGFGDDPYMDIHSNHNCYCIVKQETEERIGIVAIWDNYPTKKDWNIGYLLAKEYRGNGYAREAVNAVIGAIKNEHIFGLTRTRYTDLYKKRYNCKSIVGITKKENTASQKVLEKCGFEKISKIYKEDCYTYSYKLK